MHTISLIELSWLLMVAPGLTGLDTDYAHCTGGTWVVYGLKTVTFELHMRYTPLRHELHKSCTGCSHLICVAQGCAWLHVGCTRYVKELDVWIGHKLKKGGNV